MAELTADEQLVALPPVIDGAALVIPQGLLDRLRGNRDEPAATYAKETAAVERRAVDAVMAAERTLGREPEAQERDPDKGGDSLDSCGARKFR